MGYTIYIMKMEKTLLKGTCYILLAFDVSQMIKLDIVENILQGKITRGGLIPKQRSPRYFGFSTQPLRYDLGKLFFRIQSVEREVKSEAVIHDFGAISLTFSFPIENDLETIQELSEELYENESYIASARMELQRVINQITIALVKPLASNIVEDYHIFHLNNVPLDPQADSLITHNNSLITSILRGDRIGLSMQQEQEALSTLLTYTENDKLFLDWHAALLINYDSDDVRHVLEFANVALLEMRYLDNQLDQALDQAFELLTQGSINIFRFKKIEKSLKRIGQHQVDAALLYENVHNQFKTLGDQYLAKVYRLAAQKFSLPEWEDGIQKKITTLQSIYEKISDQISHKRMEAMEIAIIVLFIVDIVMGYK